MSSVANLDGKIALVTGGGTGVGLAIAHGFAANGATVYITGRRMEVLQQASEKHSNIQPLQMDITKKEEIGRAAEFIQKKHGKLNVLVNKYAARAGIAEPFYPFTQTDDAIDTQLAYGAGGRQEGDRWSNSTFFKMYDFADWARVFETNTTAAFFVTMGFLDLLKNGAGDSTSSVINVTSMVGLSNCKLSYGLLTYNCSKAALEKLSINLATEFAYNRIPVRVNCMAMGPFPSQVTGNEEMLDAHLASTPLTGTPALAPLRRAGRRDVEPVLFMIAGFLKTESSKTIFHCGAFLHGRSGFGISQEKYKKILSHISSTTN
ncbi:hypothetical protein V5O48_001882 [Marasmius crinis-equi]|uniref:NAD(P)-binding protein n=1 Tax=Marasmius crinis-equi TaxID=585013 RepID=A0ABR3FXI2_9AGAR